MTHMRSNFLEEITTPVPSNVTCALAKVDASRWERGANEVSALGGTLLSLWGSDDRDRDDRFRIYAAYLLPGDILLLAHEIDNLANPTFSSLASVFPSALRMERTTHDLLGISSTITDRRGWLRHGGWPEGVYPLRQDFDGKERYTLVSEPYAFTPVDGDGVHEIAVGPVHAGTIEPGHFRFSVVGEKVLRLEERLGYKHKGVAKRFEQMQQEDGQRLAARLSGDSAAAFSWAYCAALESLTQTTCPVRGAHLRALALEHERIANHLGDLGALGNDAGFAFGLTQFSRLKEDLLRANAKVFGARYLMDFIVPGGVALDLSENAPAFLHGQYQILDRNVRNLRTIYDEHGGVQDRFREAGRLAPELAGRLGALGLVGRASDVRCDLRVNHPWAPYDTLGTKMTTQSSGDVAARVQVRFDEILESLRLCRTLLQHLAPGPIRAKIPFAEPDRLGVGLIEGWRGPTMIALEAGPNGTIRRCHAHDPSWQNWPLLEHAILGNIVPDFPLINKSFNLSYSGQDG